MNRGDHEPHMREETDSSELSCMRALTVVAAAVDTKSAAAMTNESTLRLKDTPFMFSNFNAGKQV